ncbi:MAG: hypothetical protein F6K23_39715 [Okeania sp. SIO2C9]|nr:hypothetical protein [Okeania sp. SIO2C9]
MIVTTLKRLNELGPEPDPNKSPWYNHYLFHSLKPFTRTEVEQLVSILKTPQLRDAIQKIAGGHPALSQIAGYMLCRKVRIGEFPNTEEFSEEFERETRQFFQNTWERCNQVEQTLLIFMALAALKGRLHKKMRFDLSGIDLIFSQRERELINLEEQGVIVGKSQEGKKEYFLTSAIMESWVIQEVWNTDEPSLQARKKMFLNLMSHGQAKKLSETIHWLWEHKDIVPSTLEWVGKILAAVPKGGLQG